MFYHLQYYQTSARGSGRENGVFGHADQGAIKYPKPVTGLRGLLSSVTHARAISEVPLTRLHEGIWAATRWLPWQGERIRLDGGELATVDGNDLDDLDLRNREVDDRPCLYLRQMKEAIRGSLRESAKCRLNFSRHLILSEVGGIGKSK